ncbi:response regulator transcription factor [Mucilaginibacter paludis]|uniref:Response regulator receiver protein n=1 Tax=Mucilaginibacter paludis DSM 18603 TaxID=714943 RepID=H1YFC3_9SPHI|nr:response regulator transcription factor [Mucilaginibacter paludis]EHQ26262.1 response regulator receiver protein [Mucilaginibacter paludis DSM 18603]
MNEPVGIVAQILPAMLVNNNEMKDMCKRILVLDDDLAILSAIRDILEYNGYEVNTFSRGDEIFENIRRYHPDLILLDVMLANLDGREICQNIKQKQEQEGAGKIPVILISATHNLGDCLHLKNGPDDFLEKPFDISSLLDKVEAHLAAA